MSKGVNMTNEEIFAEILTYHFYGENEGITSPQEETTVVPLILAHDDEIRRECFIRLCKLLGINSDTGFIVDKCKRIEAKDIEAAIMGKD